MPDGVGAVWNDTRDGGQAQLMLRDARVVSSGEGLAAVEADGQRGEDRQQEC